MNTALDATHVEQKFKGVVPVLPAADVDATLAFYRDTLGFSIEGRHQNEGGDVVFGSVLCGRANLYLAKTTEPIVPVRCFVFVDDDVDALCSIVESRGATIVEPPEDKPWGYRQFTIRDVNGHLLHYFRFSNGVE